MEKDLMALLAGSRHIPCGQGLELRLLSAMEVLEARREASGLAADGKERALCANACLLARALEKGGRPVFSDGAAVLKGLSAVQIGRLARQWAEFDQEENPSPTDRTERVEALKKVWSTRLKRAFAGVCSGPLARCLRKHGQKK